MSGPKSTSLARDSVRKLEQAVGHAEDMRSALGRGDWEGAWEAAIKLKKTTAAARHLVDSQKSTARRERG